MSYVLTPFIREENGTHTVVPAGISLAATHEHALARAKELCVALTETNPGKLVRVAIVGADVVPSELFSV